MDAAFVRARDIAALEAFQFGAVNVSSLLERVLPTLTTGIAGFVGRFSATDHGVKLKANRYEFVKELTTHKYMDLAPITSYVPEGLDKTYLEYGAVLKAAADHASHVEEYLADVSSYLGGILSNRDNRMGGKSKIPKYIGIEKERNELNESLGHCFKNGSTRAEVAYSEVVDRNNDWLHVFDLVDSISRMMNAVNRKRLNDRATDAVNMLTKIMELHKKGELEGLAPEVIGELSEGTFQAACELEFFAIVYYRSMNLASCVDNTVDNIRRIISQK
jgi:hypothetical protein